MGANAQTSVPKFTAGQVLTAAQMGLIDTGVPVFATTTTRDAAFGGSNKTLAEGQYAYIEASKQTQFYTGTAWQAVNGMTLVASASVSAAASFSLAASTFTSTYAHYRIVGAFTSNASGASQTVTMRLRAGGTDNSNSEYLFSNMRGSTAIGGATAASGTTTSFLIVPAMTAPNRINFAIDIYNPQATENTAISGTCSALQNNADMFSIVPSGVMSVTTSYDSATFIISSGGFTGGYRVYAYV